VSSRPILHGTAFCPLLRFPRGAKLRLKVIMDADLPLSGKEIVFAARSQFATAGQRPVFRCTRTGTAEAWTDSSPNTIELSLAPDAVDETEDSELTLADLQEGRDVLWRLDILDEDGWPRLRLQGDMQWLQEEGAWEDDPRSTPAIPSLNVSIIEGVASVTVALISDGASVNNASVVAAIEEDPAAARTALGLGSAALVPEEEFVGVMRMQDAEDSIGAVAADLATLSASLGDAATKDVGVANGVADLDGDGKIPAARIPAIAISGVTGLQAALDAKIQQNSEGVISVTGSNNVLGQSGLKSTYGNTGIFFSQYYMGLRANGDWIFRNSDNQIPTVLNRLGFTATSNFAGSASVCFRMESTSEISVDSGTNGAYLNFRARDIAATRYFVPASYTVSAANALVGVPTGAVVTISNETGGMVLAQYNGTNWRRQTDLATIS